MPSPAGSQLRYARERRAQAANVSVLSALSDVSAESESDIRSLADRLSQHIATPTFDDIRHSTFDVLRLLPRRTTPHSFFFIRQILPGKQA